MTILQDDIPMWRTLRSFLLAGGSPAFPKVRSFMQKYGATDCNAFYRLQGVQESKAPSEGVKTNLGDPVASGGAKKMVETMEKLGMIEKAPDPLDQCPF